MSSLRSKPCVAVMLSQAVDSAAVAQNIEEIISSDYANRYDVIELSTINDFINMLQQRAILATILDHLPPQKDGFNIAGEIKIYSPTTRTILLSDNLTELVEGNENIDACFAGMNGFERTEEPVREALDCHLDETLGIKQDRSLESFDTAVSVLRGAIGLIPYGSIFAELLGIVIPNQRMVRLEKLITILLAKVADIEEGQLRAKTSNPQFIDLFETAAFQAVRATTDERLEYIVSLLKNSLTDEEIDFIGYKTMLALLGELNDIEIIILKFHSIVVRGEKEQQFLDVHYDTVSGPAVVMGSPRAIIDKGTIHEVYRENLTRLGLIKMKFKTPKRGELPEFNEDTGMIESQGRVITPLGSLLLRHIDQADLAL